MAEIKPMSAKIAFWALGLMLIFIAANSFKKGMIDYTIPTLMIAASAIILVETGIKKFTSLSGLRSLNLSGWISLILGLVVLVVGLSMLPFVPFEAPSVFLTLTGFGVGLLGLMVIVQAYY